MQGCFAVVGDIDGMFPAGMKSALVRVAGHVDVLGQHTRNPLSMLFGRLGNDYDLGSRVSKARFWSRKIFDGAIEKCVGDGMHDGSERVFYRGTRRIGTVRMYMVREKTTVL